MDEIDADLAQAFFQYKNSQLQRLQQNICKEFCICRYNGDNLVHTFGADTWDDDWNLLFMELIKNTSVDSVNVELQCCPVESLILLIKYIGSSPKLKNLIIHFDLQDYKNHIMEQEEQQQHEEKEIPERYRFIIDGILYAVRLNPVGIQTLKLHCLGNQESIQHVLTGNISSLTTFELVLNNDHYVSMAMATCLAAGLRNNKTLQNIVLVVCMGHLDILLSGLCHQHRGQDDDADSMSLSSSLQTLTISHRFEYPAIQRNSQLGLRLLETIKCNPSLKKLVIQAASPSSAEDEYAFSRRSWVGDILKKLHHVDCAGLEILHLHDIPIGTHRQDDDEGCMKAADWIVPAEHANWTLKELFLINVRFGTPLSVRLLWNLRGVKRLYMDGMVYPQMDSAYMDEDSDEDGDDWCGCYDDEDGYDESDHDDNDDSDSEANEDDAMSGEDNGNDEIGANGSIQSGECNCVEQNKADIDESNGSGNDDDENENGPHKDDNDGANESIQVDKRNVVEQKDANIDENNADSNDDNDKVDHAIHGKGNCGTKGKKDGLDQNIGSKHRADNDLGMEEILEKVNNSGDDGDEPVDYWAEFIRQCTELAQVYVGAVWYGVYASVLRGACGHVKLQNLTLKPTDSLLISKGELRTLFRKILQETKCLKGLCIDNIGPQHDLATGLAEGLRENKSLEKLVLTTSIPMTETASFCSILESLIDNETMHHFDLCGQYFIGDSHKICEALSHLFRVNRSLFHIGLPSLDLRGQMRGLLEALGQNMTLKSLDLICCLTNAADFIHLRESLVNERQNIPLEHIGLPNCPLNEATGLSLSEVQDFFRKTVRMQRMKTVDFGGHRAYLQDENCLKLLLHSVKENKNLCSFGASLHSLDGPLVSEIKYYLKLNRFGRRGFDSRKLFPGHFPAILAPMTKQTMNVDALFFFIRQYFMRYSYPLRCQHQGQEPRASAPKRARVEETLSRKKNGHV